MSQPRRWGQKTAWAKQYFTLQQQGDDCSGNSSSHNNDNKSSNSSDTNREDTGPVTEMAPSVKRRKKEVKALELAASTVWCCRRCGWRTCLPRDATTGRPVVALLAQHLEHDAGKGGNGSGNKKEDKEKGSSSSLGFSFCSAGPILFANSSNNSEKGGVTTTTTAREEGEGHADSSQTETSCSSSSDEAKLAQLLSSLPRAGTTAGPFVFIVVENPKTPANLGSILRAMGCLCIPSSSTGAGSRADDHGNPAAQLCNANSVIGGFLYTGSRLRKACQHQHGQQEEEEEGDRAAAKEERGKQSEGHAACVGATDAQRAAEHVPQVCLHSLQGLFDFLQRRERKGDGEGTATPRARTVAVDLIVGAVPLPAYTHPFALSLSPSRHGRSGADGKELVGGGCRGGERPSLVFYLFGPEDGSLSSSLLEQCDDAVFMPTIGSLNLAASVNVLLYDRIAKDYLALHSARQEGWNGAEEEAGPLRKKRSDSEREGSSSFPVSSGGGGGDNAYFACRNTNNHLTWRKRA